MRVFTEETIAIGQDLCEILDDVALIDLWIALKVSKNPDDNLELEDRLCLRELVQELVCLRLLWGSFEISNKDVLDNLKRDVEALDFVRMTANDPLAIPVFSLSIVLQDRRVFVGRVVRKLL